MLFAAIAGALTAMSPQAEPRDLRAILESAGSGVARVLEDSSGHRLQISLAEVVETERGLALRRQTYGDLDHYFYPASSIKICAAVAALLELNRLNVVSRTAFDLDTRLAIEPRFEGDARQVADTSNLGGAKITIGHEIRKLCVVSDNVAFNRLYELVGHRELNQAMWDAGFTSCRILHRLSEFRSVEEQRMTRAVVISAGDSSLTLPARDSDLVLDNGDLPAAAAGSAYIRDGRRVDEPFSFRHKNAIALRDLQDLLVEILRPEIDTGKRGFPGLSIEQREFLAAAMRTLPRESANPVYDPSEYPDEHTKFVLPGVRRVIPSDAARVYDKIGRAYGFSTENAYIEDARTGRGLFLAAAVYTNPNGTLNDDDYGYAEIADPFFADLGAAVARLLLEDGD